MNKFNPYGSLLINCYWRVKAGSLFVCACARLRTCACVCVCVNIHMKIDFFNFFCTLCLQEASASVSRGKITQYTVRVYGPDSRMDKWMNFSADLRSCLVPFCADCKVTVWSHNSKGTSPPARVSTRHRKGSELALCVALFRPVGKRNDLNATLESLRVFVCDSPATLTQQMISLSWSSTLWVTTVFPSRGKNLKVRDGR